MRQSGFFKTAGLVAAATVGDGVFALPFVFLQAGWLLSIFYLLILGGIVVLAHTVYLRTLEKVDEKERLLGLARRYLGPGGFWVGFMAIVLGLLLTLVAYLILGTQFIALGFPGVPPLFALFGFWLFVSATTLVSDRHVLWLELSGIAFTAITIILIFTTAWPAISFNGSPAINWANGFLPFGAVLFSLAGWTAVEPSYEMRKRMKVRAHPFLALAAGTAFAALLYAMFAAGILGSAGQITPDTISGLGNWPTWKRDMVAALGLFAVWTVSIPISREIKNALQKDLRWTGFTSRLVILLFPISLVLFGLNNFLVVVGLVGGLFLSLQYLLIISVGRRALALSAPSRWALDAVAGAFILAAVYEVWIFIVH